MTFTSNKKGQFESIIYIIISLFVIGVFVFFVNHLDNQIYDKFDTYFEGSTKYNNSEAHQAINTVQDVENDYYDYIFLAAFVGFLLQMSVLAYATRISIAFFWIFVILGGVGLFVGTMLSNIWQEMASNAEFATSITRFPITNAILGTYFPTAITGIVLIVLLFTFGKPNQGGQ